MSAHWAENGRNPHSINVISKAGEQQYPGQMGWYFRNEDLNAKNYLSTQAGRPRQEYRYNIGSYFFSGPVPQVNRGRKKLFFFFNQAYQVQAVSYAVNEPTEPTTLERTGAFSKSYNTNGSPTTINAPLNA